MYSAYCTRAFVLVIQMLHGVKTALLSIIVIVPHCWQKFLWRIRCVGTVALDDETYPVPGALLSIVLQHQVIVLSAVAMIQCMSCLMYHWTKQDKKQQSKEETQNKTININNNNNIENQTIEEEQH